MTSNPTLQPGCHAKSRYCKPVSLVVHGFSSAAAENGRAAVHRPGTVRVAQRALHGLPGPIAWRCCPWLSGWVGELVMLRTIYYIHLRRCAAINDLKCPSMCKVKKNIDRDLQVFEKQLA